MKVKLNFGDGSWRVVNLVGPLNVIEHPRGAFDILHDDGTGWDYWFRRDTGAFDGTGASSTVTGELSADEAKALMRSLKEMADGDTKSVKEIRDGLNKPN